MFLLTQNEKPQSIINSNGNDCYQEWNSCMVAGHQCTKRWLCTSAGTWRHDRLEQKCPDHDLLYLWGVSLLKRHCCLCRSAGSHHEHPGW